MMNDEKRGREREGEKEEGGGERENEEIDLPPRANEQDKYERWREDRWKVLVLVALPCLVVSMSGSAIIPSLTAIRNAFNISTTTAALIPSLWAITQAVFSLIFSPISDYFSRRKIYLVSLGLFIILTAACGLAWDIYSLLVFRSLCAVCCSPLLSMGYASIADVFPPLERGTALSWFSLAPLMSPIVGPIFGGLIVNYVSWNALFWIIGALGLPIWVSLCLFLPETLDPSTLPQAYDPLFPIKLWFRADVWPIFGVSACISTLFTIYVLFALLAPEIFDISPAVSGAITAVFGIGILIGSQLGGSIVDFFARRHGSGGRLFSVAFTMFFACVPILLFCLFLDRVLWVVVACMILGGFCVGFPRAGALTFAIEKYPSNAAGVSCSLMSSAYILAFLSVPFATTINDNFGLIYFAAAMMPMLFIYGFANLHLVFQSIGDSATVQSQTNQSESSKGGEKTEDIELKEFGVEADEKR